MRYIDGCGYYTVSEVAAAAGVSAQTIRVWQRLEGVPGRRTSGGHRLFDERGLQIMVERAARRRRSTAETPPQPKAEQTPDRPTTAVGVRVRAIRTAAGLTQREIADRASVSRSLLSAIERGESGVSMTLLSGIADALDVPLAEFAPPTPSAQRLVRKASRPQTSLGDGVTWEELATFGHSIAPAILVAEPGSSSGAGVVAIRENFVTIIDGELEIRLPDARVEVVLTPGDGLMLLAGETYAWQNTTRSTVRALWIEQLRG